MVQMTANDNGLASRLRDSEDGSVWLDWMGEGPPVSLNLGPDSQVDEVFADRLAQRDFGERPCSG